MLIKTIAIIYTAVTTTTSAVYNVYHNTLIYRGYNNTVLRLKYIIILAVKTLMLGKIPIRY